MSWDDSRGKGLIEANAAFYRAFADGDLRAMSALWADHDDLVCIHPGHERLTGRSPVLASWFAILENPPPVRTSDARAVPLGQAGLVTCTEAIGNNRLAATNAFEWDGKAWRMVLHQAGPVLAEDRREPGRGPSGAVH